ncbi:hypothetical protein [Paenibacillus xanthanilyticus]|uniref:PASTA domain-containing protein n=1 Tax=Paenibacillus xanthanilyticus TaxID=1783531 RepID=A0ABV8KCB2_9BACL
MAALGAGKIRATKITFEIGGDRISATLTSVRLALIQAGWTVIAPDISTDSSLLTARDPENGQWRTFAVEEALQITVKITSI